MSDIRGKFSADELKVLDGYLAGKTAVRAAFDALTENGTKHYPPEDVVRMVKWLRDEAFERGTEDRSEGIFSDPEGAQMCDDIADTLIRLATQPQKREIAPALPERVGPAGENCGEKSE